MAAVKSVDYAFLQTTNRKCITGTDRMFFIRNHANLQLSNQVLLHLHCHDQTHAHGINDNDPCPEEPDEVKACPEPLEGSHVRFCSGGGVR